MTDPRNQACTAFAGENLFASGPLVDVVVAIMTRADADDAVAPVVYDDATGMVIELDLRGTTAEAVARLTQDSTPAVPPPRSHTEGKARGRGRPKLGVVPREVTLLPRHWDWLAAQPGNISQTLRRLVDEARRADRGQAERTARERSYRFLAAQAGNRPGYEEAIRALFAGDAERFARSMDGWPAAVRDFALRLANPDTPGDPQ
jgi:hypothetical protein